jgi:hypothetical protein
MTNKYAMVWSRFIDSIREGLHYLWHPLPFISESATKRVLWFTPLAAFVLFVCLIASLAAVR